MNKHTPTPWQVCGHTKPDGICQCGVISGADSPVATVTIGDWGDSYPEIRLVDGPNGKVAEAYLERMDYGHVPKEIASANAEFIVRAVNCHDELVEALQRLIPLEPNCYESDANERSAWENARAALTKAGKGEG